VFYYSTITIYIFHFIVTFFFLLALIAIKNIFFDKTGFAFMAFGFLKMLASIVFLLPLIQAENVNYISDVLAFFVPYFLFLLFDIYFTIKLLNSIPKE
jgi:surface polysaccharide O-acyltransferase-like enzyme